jgi:hypothetical protein
MHAPPIRPLCLQVAQHRQLHVEAALQHVHRALLVLLLLLEELHLHTSAGAQL